MAESLCRFVTFRVDWSYVVFAPCDCNHNFQSLIHLVSSWATSGVVTDGGKKDLIEAEDEASYLSS